MSTELKQIERIAQMEKKKKQKEGFQNVMDKQIAIEKMIETTKITNLDLLQKMKEKYDRLVVQYNAVLNKLKNSTMDNIKRTANNPFLNKNIRFSNDVICYVTSEGVAKPYQSYEVFMQNSGKNGCPNSTYIDVDISWLSSYVEGSVIPLSPSLVVGKPMELDQSCGNEGMNIYVTKMVSKPSATYTGCYITKESGKGIPSSEPLYTTYEECEKYASDNGYKYFGLENMRSDGKSVCKVYNSPSDYQQYGPVETILDSCSVINDKHYGVSPGTNAVYKLKEVGNRENLGKIAYVTGDGEINEYDDNMIGFYNEYDIQNDYDSYGNTLKEINNVSKDECINQCNVDGTCAGFVHQSDGSKCFLKNKNTYPRAPKQYLSGSGATLGVRKKKILPVTTCKKETVEVDTIQYQNYANGKIIKSGKDCDLNIVSQKYKTEFDELKNKLSMLGEEISMKMEEMYSMNKNVYQDMQMSESEFKENIKKYRSNINRVRNETDIPMINFNYENRLEGMTNMQTLTSMLSDADIRLLEENYNYIFWSILAVGMISTTINII